MNMLLIGLGLIILVGIYYYYSQSDIEEPMTEKKPEFIASKKFNGKKKGYYFRADEKGLGYYLDKK